MNLKKNTTKPTAYLVKFLNPQEIIDQLEIYPGMSIAHFGCGRGYFTFAAAKKLGDEGKIYALDVMERKIDLIKSQVKSAGLSNVFTKRANLEDKGGSGLRDESCDWVFLINMLYQNENKSHIIGEAKRVLKKGGHILVIDWSDSPIGPEKSVRVAREALIKIARKYDMGIQKEIPVSDFHFGMILVK